MEMNQEQKFAAYYASKEYQSWRASVQEFIATLPSLQLPNDELTRWLDANPPPPFV